MIRNLNIKKFGSISERSISFKGNLNIIYGLNESGKSTIHEAIRSLLFGFSPASLDAHRYKPWDDSKIQIDGELEFEDKILLSRKLSEKPEALITIASNVKKYPNRAISQIDYISREIFKQVYAITIDDMTSLKEKSMEDIFDDIVENYGLDFLNSPSEVIKAIQGKENEIYRENRRGNYRVKEIDEEIKKISHEIRSCEKDVGEYFSSKIRLDEAKEEKAKISEELFNIEKLSAKIMELMDIAKDIDIIHDFRRENAYKKHAVGKLYEKVKKIRELEGELNLKGQNIGLLNIDIEREKLKLVELNEEENEILSKRPDYIIIKNLALVISQIEEKIDLKTDKYNEEKYSRSLLEKELFSRELSIGERKELRELDLISLKKYFEKNILGSDTSRDYNIKARIVALLIIGLLAFGGLYLNYNQVFYGLSLLLSSLAMKTYLEYKNISREKTTYDMKIYSLLEGLPIPEVYLEEIDSKYLESLIFLWNKEGDIRSLEEDLDNLKLEKNQKWEKILTKLNDTRLRIDSVSLDSLNIILADIYKKIEDIKIKEMNQNSLADRIREIELRVETIAEEKKHLMDILESLVLETCLNFSIEKEKIRDMIIDDSSLVKAWQIEKKLNSIDSIELKTQEISKLRDQGIIFTYDYISNLKADANKLVDSLKAIENTIGTLEEKLKYMYSVDRRDELVSDLKTLNKERKSLMIRRAVLTTTRETIARYDKDFREENQPDILKNTSKYFALITNNKYQRVYMDKETNELLLKSDFGPKNIDEGFSRGTREQLYFAFRLAIIKHLSNEKRHKLPLILDDIFVNWDIDRLENLRELLIEISKERQIIFFTCHKSHFSMFDDDIYTNRIIL